MSSSSRPPAQASKVTGVTLDPSSQPFTLKPLIAKILQTSTCIPGSVFLVERIEADLATSTTSRYRAVRLLLGDGELCIQALLTGDLHGMVDGKMIYEGCYVRLGRLEFRTFNVQYEDGTRDKSAYLLVQDMAVAGWSKDYMEILKNPKPVDEDEEVHQLKDGNPYVELDLAEGTIDDAKHGDVGANAETGLRGGHAALDTTTTSDNEDGFEVMHISPSKATQRRQIAHWEASSAPGPWQATDPSKPMKLTPLRGIPHLPYKQNWRVNVLAVVAALSELEPSHLPPHSQRTVRLADPSTTKQVLLTVFLDAAEFVPAVGSVVLLVGVKNHRFDGGCLKKYVSDKPPDGERWWFENPTVDWCDVAGLREWWDAREPES